MPEALTDMQAQAAAPAATPAAAATAASHSPPPPPHPPPQAHVELHLAVKDAENVVVSLTPVEKGRKLNDDAENENDNVKGNGDMHADQDANGDVATPYADSLTASSSSSYDSIDSETVSNGGIDVTDRLELAMLQLSSLQAQHSAEVEAVRKQEEAKHQQLQQEALQIAELYAQQEQELQRMKEEADRAVRAIAETEARHAQELERMQAEMEEGIKEFSESAIAKTAELNTRIADLEAELEEERAKSSTMSKQLVDTEVALVVAMTQRRSLESKHQEASTQLTIALEQVADLEKQLKDIKQQKNIRQELYAELKHIEDEALRHAGIDVGKSDESDRKESASGSHASKHIRELNFSFIEEDELIEEFIVEHPIPSRTARSASIIQTKSVESELYGGQAMPTPRMAVEMQLQALSEDHSLDEVKVEYGAGASSNQRRPSEIVVRSFDDGSYSHMAFVEQCFKLLDGDEQLMAIMEEGEEIKLEEEEKHAKQLAQQHRSVKEATISYVENEDENFAMVVEEQSAPRSARKHESSASVSMSATPSTASHPSHRAVRSDIIPKHLSFSQNEFSVIVETLHAEAREHGAARQVQTICVDDEPEMSVHLQGMDG